MTAATTRPVVALLTDFGLHDHYVGVMKGVVLGICPEATFVDITHDIAPQDIVGGALALEVAAPYFPDGTVFLVVVDPGVGSARRAVAVETSRHRYVGPDNGVLAAALAGDRVTAVEIREERYRLPAVSRTFEGRDRFAPAAAWLAAGTALTALGPAIDTLRQLPLPVPVQEQDSVRGEVLTIDRFGNLTTNIGRDLLALLRPPLLVWLDEEPIGPVVDTYADVAAGTPCALVGSSERLEIAVSGGSAAARFGAGRGAAVRVRSAA